MTNWQVGMEAVCISDDVYLIPFNAIRVVREVLVVPKGTFIETWSRDGPTIRTFLLEDELCLRFMGINGNHAYLAQFFRPVQKRKTDISIFTSLLKPTKQKENV